eukprot:m.55115 g.55115  ORF g.55115 m.55115 type:complete len:389 (+) comp15535_c0_seq10:270-1436(+)
MSQHTLITVSLSIICTLIVVQLNGRFFVPVRERNCRDSRQDSEKGTRDTVPIDRMILRQKDAPQDSMVTKPALEAARGITSTRVPSTEDQRHNISLRLDLKILAIPVMFEVGCDTQLSAVQVDKLETRARTMQKSLKEHNLPAQPALFCNQEKLEDSRPICSNNQSQRKDSSLKTLNIAKNFLQAFYTCANQEQYEVCLIMEDDTILHPNFTVEARALMDDLPADWQLVHLCPGLMRGNAGPAQYTKGRISKLEDWHWFPQPNVEFGEKRCQGLGCNTTTGKCALASLEKRYWVKDEPLWGGQAEVFVPCISWIGGPQAYLVKPAEAKYLAKHVSQPLYCGTKIGPNDLALSYQSRYSFKRHHYMARDPQLCFEPGNDEKSSSFSTKT